MLLKINHLMNDMSYKNDKTYIFLRNKTLNNGLPLNHYHNLILPEFLNVYKVLITSVEFYICSNFNRVNFYKILFLQEFRIIT
jgi:hypothetical protein